MLVRKIISQEVVSVADSMAVVVSLDDVMTRLEGTVGLDAVNAQEVPERMATLRDAILNVLGDHMTMTDAGAASLTGRLQAQGNLPMWTIYDHPTDYPDGFIARLFLTLPDLRITRSVVVAPTLSALRARLPMGLVCMTRAPDDDPRIVETWL